MKVLAATLTAFIAYSCDAYITPAINKNLIVNSNQSVFGVARQLKTFSNERNNESCSSSSRLKAENKPFFASEEKTEEAEQTQLDGMTEEEEVQMLVDQEIKKTKRMSNLRNSKGVDYAPWMNISEEDESKIRAIMVEKTAARRARQEQERNVSGNLLRDSQAQELSGTGLNYKVIDGQVELEWATKSEKDTKGFVVKRRKAKTDEFETIASFQDWGPLASKGVDGGIYRYLDTDVTPGGWVYRITEQDNNGVESDICQCLVELQTDEEQRGAVIAAGGFAVFAILATVAGLTLDPLQ